jgi:uncharacterized protein (TIGR03437 family)
VAADRAGNFYFGSLHSVFKVDPSGALTRVAGNGRYGYSGDGGPSTAAQLEFPDGIAVDSAGNVYVADKEANVVRVITPALTITTYAGTGAAGYGGDGGPAAQALLNAPVGLALDSSGNLYIADSNNHVIRKVAKNGVITTAAGNGTQGFGGDGGAATAAALNQPEGVAADSAGRLYIADTLNDRVRLVSADGTIQTVVGTGVSTFTGDNAPAASSALFLPTDVAVDGSGNLYIADFGNSRLRKVSQGKIQTIAGSADGSAIHDQAPATTVVLNGPTGIAVDSSGNIFFAEGSIGTGTGLAIGDYRIWEVVSLGVIVAVAGNGMESYSGDGLPAAAAQLNAPAGVALDGAGNIYIADSANHRVRKIAPGGGITTVAGTGIAGFSGDGGPAAAAELSSPHSVAVDAAGNLYIADTDNHRIRKVTPQGSINTIAGNGNPAFFGDGGAAVQAAIHSPQGVAVDGSGNVYIADTLDQRVRKVAADGTIITVAGSGSAGYGGDGGTATSAQLNLPSGVAADSAGNLYIADTGNNRVRVVTAAGTISTLAGGASGLGDGGPAAGAGLAAPGSVAVDSSGNVYVSDTGHNRVRVISAAETINTLAGNGVCCYSGDGGPAANAQLNAPAGLAIDSTGRLFVADTGNNAVRLVQTAPAGGAPAISAIANGASNRPGGIAPGEIVVIFGTGLGPAQLVAAPVNGDTLPTQLGGSSVLFNGTPAQLLYASASQVSAIVPANLSGSSAQLSVQYQGLNSAPVGAAVVPAAPAIFTANATGVGQAVAINADGTANSAANPAPEGSFVTLLVTGVYTNFLLGTPVSVTIGGQPVTEFGANRTVGTPPGVSALPVQVPHGIPAGAAAVIVQVGTATSPVGVTIAVSGN